MGFFFSDEMSKKIDDAVHEATGNSPKQKEIEQAKNQRQRVEWHLGETFGTTDLDFVLRNYAPKTYQLLVKAAAAAADKNE